MATVKKTSRNYVNSILDAAAMASRADTLDGMLNQLPGLLMQQEQQKRAEETEAERYKDQIQFRNTSMATQEKQAKEQRELSLMSLVSGYSPEMTEAFLSGIDVETELGNSVKNATQSANVIRKTNIQNVTTQLNNLSTLNVADYTLEEIETLKQDIQSTIYSDPYLTNNFSKQLQGVDKVLSKKMDNNFILEFVSDPSLGLSEQAIQTIKNSKNPSDAFEIVKDSLSKDSNPESLTKLMNAYSAYRNSRKDALGDVDETPFDINLQTFFKDESAKLAGDDAFDASFNVPKGSVALSPEDIQNFDGKESYVSQEGVTYKITYNENQSSAYATPVAEKDVEKPGFIKRAFKAITSKKQMPKSQENTFKNMLQNFPENSPEYKRAFNALEQAGLLPEQK